MAATRRLAAILAADVAGYSRLMGTDEEGTLERLVALCREPLDSKPCCRALPRRRGSYRGISARTNPFSRASFLLERLPSERS
jgi:hypothetical protein